jgi:hypothetical protein
LFIPWALLPALPQHQAQQQAQQQAQAQQPQQQKQQQAQPLPYPASTRNGITPSVLRLNLYRYDYPGHLPNGSWDRHTHELSAWSPSGYGNFHLPQYFGIGVLV